MVSIGEHPVQRSFQVMGMYVRSLRNVCPGGPDGFSVFDDGRTGRDVLKSKLMPRRNIFLKQKTGLPVGFGGLTGIAFGNPCSGRQRLKRNGNAVLRMDSDVGLHDYLSFRRVSGI